MTKIIPVIHYENDEQALRNANIAFGTGCDGVFLIEMSGNNRPLPLIAKVIKTRHPDKLVGMNLLGVDPADAIAINIAAGMDMTWTDVPLTHSAYDPWEWAQSAREAMVRDYGHQLFSGVAFKHQREEPNPALSALKAIELGFIPTTSGPATGVAAEASKIADLRQAIGPDSPLAIASGITPENAGEFAPFLSHILVATGVCSSFYEFDAERLKKLKKVIG